MGGVPLEVTLGTIIRMAEGAIPGSVMAVSMVDSDGQLRVRAAPGLSRAVVHRLDEVAARSADHLFDELSGDRGLADEDLVANRVIELSRSAPGAGRSDWLGTMTVLQPRGPRVEPSDPDALARLAHLAAIALERRRFEATLEYQARYDGLTGLPNRALLRSRLADALARAERRATGVAVVFLDLDRFKVVNDSVGHELGDRLLQLVAERLRAPLRAGDTLGRFGGDEFMVVCHRIPDTAAAEVVALRVAAELEDPFLVGDGEVFVTASIGIAHSADGSGSPEALMRNADVAMYRAKAQGRNQYVVFAEEHDQAKLDQLSLEQALRRAIDDGELELYFQPAVHLADGAVTHVEALVRWNRPGHGLVPPDRFIPLAEETGLIVPLGWWVLDRAGDLAAAWPELPGGEKVQVAVNLSARQLMASELHERVAATLERTGVDPSRLCFEVTETDLVHDVDRAKAALVQLKDLGVKIAIDDFGTGYASLEYLRHFTMADFLKIDRSFVDGIEHPGSHEAAIVAAAVALGKALGLAIVAEGVETSHQLEVLRRLECDLAQGYLFSRPVPVDEAVVLLADPATIHR